LISPPFLRVRSREPGRRAEPPWLFNQVDFRDDGLWPARFTRGLE
jgi:hypothetical protein